jgi:RimJ/RimL family protein N-acetyltransferase
MEPNSTDIDYLGQWVWRKQDNHYWFPQGKSAVGYVDPHDGLPKWAVVYDDYEPGGSIKMHTAIADPKYVSRRAIFAVFEYPFYQLGVKKVLATVNSENYAALTLDLRLGFEVEAVIEDAYDVGNMYILSMTREQCRWLRGIEDGKLQEAATAA